MIYFAIEFKDKKFKDAYISGDANARFNIRSLHFANKKVMLKYRWFDESDTLIYEVRSPYSAGIEIMQLISRLGLGSPVAGKVKGGVVKTGSTNIKDREGFISNFLSEDFLQEDYVAIPVVGKIEPYGGPFFFYKKEEVIKDRYRLSTGSGAPFEQVILTPSKRSHDELQEREKEKNNIRKDKDLRNAPVLDLEERFDIEEHPTDKRDDSITPDIQRKDAKDVDWGSKASDVVLGNDRDQKRREAREERSGLINSERLNDVSVASSGVDNPDKGFELDQHIASSLGAPEAKPKQNNGETAVLQTSGQMQTAGIGGLSNNATAAAVLGAILTGAIAHSIEKKSVKDISNTIDQKFSQGLRTEALTPSYVTPSSDKEDVVSKPNLMPSRNQADDRWNIIRGASVFDLDK